MRLLPAFRGGAALLASLAFASAEPVISEFMASNGAALADGDGNFHDWVELHNPDPQAVDLEGWGLRDSSRTWGFPAGAVIAPGGYLVVFASGQGLPDYVDAGGNLHTTFRLDAAGEPLALLRPDGGVAFEYAAVPDQQEDVGYGIISTTETLVATDSPARHRVPAAPPAGDWTQAAFDDSSWHQGAAAVGYKTGPGPVLGGGPGSHTAYLVEEGTPGNQAYGGSLGMDFEVLQEIRVTDLGVFDAGSNGLSLTINAQLWSRSGNSGIAILASESFSPGDPGTLEGGSRFKPLPTQLVLAPGSYTMVAYGYGSAELNGNQGTGGLDGLDIDPGDGLLQFVGNARYGNAGAFPITDDGGPANRYAAGTFRYGPNSSDVETDVEAEMFNTNPGILLRVPFDLADPAAIDALQLEMGYDDGFVAWINGIEIARQNAPPTLAFDSSATASANAIASYPAALPAGTLLENGNVLAVHGLNASAASGDFIVAPTLTGIDNDTATARYFTRPTPGGPNDPDGVVGFVADTRFSVDRGFFDAPFDVAITSATPGAEIRYTTDGSEPSETRGTLYPGPVNITGTTVLRAIAYLADHQATDVDTQSYLFPEQVAAQDNSPAGYPSGWAGVPADYAMDPNAADFARAAGDASFTPAEARAAIAQSLRALPTLSIVTEKDELFDPATGIYLNPSGRGAQWERPVSVEIIAAGGADHYQTNAGLRIMGFTSRNLNTTPKLNMRLLFKSQYGDARMEYPILGPEGPERFNTIALRGNIRDAWVAEHQGFGKATYIGDEWAKRSQYDMGQPAVRGTFAHVYLNGLYWGLYNPTERPDDDFAETHLGGDRSEYDVVKFCCPDRSIAGSIAAWDSLLAEARAGLSGNTAYQRIQGNHPDGTRNPALPVLIDVDNLIDYAINGQYHAQLDWPGNYYVIRDRVETRTEGFKFFTWDNDIPFAGGNPNAGDKVRTAPGNNWWTESPGEIEIPLRTNAEYRLRFADRAYKHYFHGGAMTVQNNIARWNALVDFVRPGLFAESARWGDAKGQSLRTVQDHWDAQMANMVNSYFPNRQAVVFNQLRRDNLYPDLDPPEFNQHGGMVPAGFGLRFDAEATVYYTTDGSDPRLAGGAVSPAASSASGGTSSLTLLPTGAAVRVLIPADGSVDATWRDPGFDDSAWTGGITGVGYENGTGYQELIELDLIADMRSISATAYLRIPFGGAEPADLQSLTLRMKYDDGFVAYLNGTRIASRNAPASPDWQSGASGFPTDEQAVVFEDIDVTADKGLLSPTGNLLAIHGLNFGVSSSDFLIIPELRGASLSGGDQVPLNATSRVRARAFDGSEWSALNEAIFIVGQPPDAAKLAVSEIMYHPATGDGAGEFIEVMNISATDTLDLTGVHFSDGITFEFPLGFTLGPGATALLVADPVGFAAAHPAAPIAGTFSGSLENAGERLALSDSAGSEFLAFRYDDKRPWPESPDGGGPSLVLIAPQTAPDPSQAVNWRASTGAGGNPAASDAVAYAGGNLLDYALAGSPGYDPDSDTLSLPVRPAADDALPVPQWSSDLLNWNEGGFTYLGGTPPQWQLARPPAGDPRLFLRFEVRTRR